MNELQTAAATPIKKRDFDSLRTSFISYLDSAPRTVETYSRALKQFFGYLQGVGVSEPQRGDVLAYKETLQAREYKPTTIQNYITAVKVFFSWTEQEGFYPNIANHIKGAKIDREFKKDYLTKSQVKEVLSAISRDSLQGLRDYAIIRLMFTSALRDIEVSRANVEDIKACGDKTVLYIQGKGREEKNEPVIIGAETEKAIRDYLAARKDYKESDPLFTSLSNNSSGARLTTRSISGTVKAALKRAGFNSSRLTAHSLRHTAITTAIIAGKRLDEVQQFARHTSINTTMIYNHALERANNSCSRTLDDLF